MKPKSIFLIGALLLTGTLRAQISADWQERVAKVQSLIQTNPTQAGEEAGELLKGKNKKDPVLLTEIGRAYLNAGNTAEAEKYLAMAKKADSKHGAVSVLEGDIALTGNDAGRACQLYEQAIYFDPGYKDAYMKYAQVYKTASPSQAIEKLKQLKAVAPDCVGADKVLAEVYYANNHFDKAAEAYGRFIDSPQATDADRLKYAFALFLNHQFEPSLNIVQKGLANNPRHAAFNRLAMYNYTDMKRYEEAEKAADAFFNRSDDAEYSLLDYRYYGHLLTALKKYDDAIVQYRKALTLDETQTALWQEIADAYEMKNDYVQAIDAYRNYYRSLKPEEQTADLLFQLGRLYYAQGTVADALAATLETGKPALMSADSIFTILASKAPESYLGNLWRARTNSALDPETTQGLAKPYYDAAASIILNEDSLKHKSALIECYSYLGYYYLLINDLAASKAYWNRILIMDPANATAQKALDGIK